MVLLIDPTLCQLKMRGQRGPAPTNDEGEVDENFWAQAAADQAAAGDHRRDDDMDDRAFNFLPKRKLTFI